MELAKGVARAQRFIGKTIPALAPTPRSRFHFVDDYREHVRKLMAKHPLEQAMSLAIGGNYHSLGRLEREILVLAGLRPEHYLVDIGCGSGRLTVALREYLVGNYLGTDVVPELIDYARTQCPPNWRVELVDGLAIPERSGVADMVCFFSVLTHLLHEESYYYLTQAVRVLKPGGKIVFSFLDITQPSHWCQFEHTVRDLGRSAPLNVFISTDMIRAWCEHLGLELERLQDGDTPWVPLSEPLVQDDGTVQRGLGTLGQSVVVLKKTERLSR